MRRFRKASKPLRDEIRLHTTARRVQRAVPLEPEDRQPKRRRWHVLVDLLTEFGPPSGVLVAEVGTHSGYTAAHLLKYCPQIARLYAIDIEKPHPDLDFITDLERVQLLLGRSAECANGFADETFDLVFVDADHSEESVLCDLQAWVPKVKRGGLITGHDYGSHNHPGVEVAVKTYFRDHPHPVRLEANKVWWTIR
ncbi:MAG: class I SAM-dependent methyltransferase [Myxococcota bacterium]